MPGDVSRVRRRIPTSGAVQGSSRVATFARSKRNGGIVPSSFFTTFGGQAPRPLAVRRDSRGRIVRVSVDIANDAAKAAEAARDRTVPIFRRALAERLQETLS